MASALSTPLPVPPESRALLDTTVQLDRLKMASRREHLDNILTQFGWTFAASMSLVEFKATILQECITIHNQLRRRGARFTRVRDALVEKQHPQISLRNHIFNNLIDVYAMSSFEISEKEDLRLAEKARLKLENDIPRLYAWFVRESVDIVLDERLECNRAQESPRKKEAAFEVNLPICRRGKNKTCRVEELIRSKAPRLIAGLQPHLEGSEQLRRAVEVFQTVQSTPDADLSHRECRRAGDCLIFLEGEEIATHAVSSNAREWRPLSDVLGMTFVQTTYPEEATR